MLVHKLSPTISKGQFNTPSTLKLLRSRTHGSKVCCYNFLWVITYSPLQPPMRRQQCNTSLLCTLMICQGSSFTKVSKLTNSTIQQLDNIQSLQTFSSRYRYLKLDFCNATVILWIASAAAWIGVHSGQIQMDLLFSAHSNRIIKQLMIVLTASCHESIIYGLDQSRRYREPVSVPPPLSVCKWQ